MKKLATVLFGGVLALALAGCGGDNSKKVDHSTATDSTVVEQQKPAEATAPAAEETANTDDAKPADDSAADEQQDANTAEKAD